MKLSDIPAGSVVFIDANVSLAVIFGERNALIAEDFLARIESEEITGVTSVVVINEIFHRSLVAETCKLLGVSPSIALRKLKKEPEIFLSLHESWEVVSDFLKLPLTIYQLDIDTIRSALHYSKMFQLLSNDATHIALMAKNGIQAMASFDHDLERVDFIEFYGQA
jgi:predicted nucleic acid-binding protein